MRASFGCVSILLASCCGCCCGRLPTFGLFPELDEAAILADLKAKPFVVDHLCTTEATCLAVQDAEIEVMPVSWNPLTGTTMALIAVEAQCVASTNLLERAQPFVCKGVLAALGVRDPSGALVITVTEETLLGLGPSGHGRGYTGGGGDWDWD